MSEVSPIKFFSEITAADKILFGGKGCNLAVLKRAGFEVPDGFCLATTALNAQHEISAQLDSELEAAYARLGSPFVAVRSSATAEDSAETSFAGAHETILNVQGMEQLRQAIRECWQSGQTDRAKTYRREHGLDDSAATMGVVVQVMVAAECAGVCFTINPHDANDQRLYIEAAHGLGDRVVSGEVMPDLFIVDREDKKIDESQKRGTSPLTDDQILALAVLALRVEDFFQAPQDIEWAARNGRIYLLQSRPITTANGKAEANDQEVVRQIEIARLRACAKPEGTVWSNFNLAEVLPAPLPLTWSMMSKFMSAEGALGCALSNLGLMPGGLAREGVVQLICGRTYFNLDREIHLYFSGFPFDHPFEKLKADPTKASYPRPEINLKRATASFWLLLPWYIYKMTRAQMKIARAEKHLAEDIETQVLPAYRIELQRERAVDLKAMSALELYAHLERLGKILERYTSQLLQPTAMAAVASGQAEQMLEKILGEKEAKFWIQRVVQGRTASSTVGENQALWEVAHGKRTLEKFLEEYGHRCVGELEMARPRWREDSQFVLRMIEHLRQQGGLSPQEKFQTQADAHLRDREELEKLLTTKAPTQKAAVLKQVNLARKFFPYRETGKHYWMMGVELVRQGLLALDAKLGLRGDIFWLQLEELPEVIAGKSFALRIADRKRHRELALKIPLPEVIFSDDLEAIGRKPKPPEGKEFTGLGVSMGVARGRAVVVNDPSEAPLMGDDAILVCRSTDPGWTPLFVQAKGLVLERGGLLSHGAVVAREFGLPAVAGIDQATQFLKTGQRLFVDGDHGKVILEDALEPTD